MDLSVVFPVFNEEENVPILLDEIAGALAGQRRVYPEAQPQDLAPTCAVHMGARS